MKPRWAVNGLLLGGILLALCFASATVALAKRRPHPQTGRIVRAEVAPRPYVNGWFAHWYTIKTSSGVISFTQMVSPRGHLPPGWPGSALPRQAGPDLSFRVGEEVRFAIQYGPLEPNKPREIYVLDREGKEHLLTIDEIWPH